MKVSLLGNESFLSGQLANPHVPELNRRAFRFEAKKAGPRITAIAAGNFFAIDPQPNLAVDAADVIVVPLTDALALIFPREAAAAVGRDGRKRPHFRRSHREYIAIGREPRRLPPGLFLVLIAVSVVENLNLDSAPGERVGLEARERLLWRPDEDPGVSTITEVLPLGDELKVRHRFFGANHPDGTPRAVNHAIFPRPGVGIAVDVGEVVFYQFLPARSRAVKISPGKRW